MQVTDHNIFFASTAMQSLLEFLLFLNLLIFLPYWGMVLGNLLFSLIFNISERVKKEAVYLQLAQNLGELGLKRKGIIVVLGILPLVLCLLILSQLFYQTPFQIAALFMPVIGLALTGFILAHCYHLTYPIREKRFYLHLGLGAAGWGLMMLAAFFLNSVLSSSLDSNYWEFTTNIYLTIFSWNAIARFKYFLALMLLSTGLSMLYLHFKWREGPIDYSTAYQKWIRNLGGGLALAGTLLLPIFLNWYLLTLPDAAQSLDLIVCGLLSVFLLFLLALRLYAYLKKGENSLNNQMLVLFILFVGVTLISDTLARGNVIREQRILLGKNAEEHRKQLTPERKAIPTAETGGDVQVGEEVFKRVCSTCHQFDKKVVGPPLLSTLPKYKGNINELTAFIGNPKKINPDYPSMPNPGLKRHEVPAVANYVLKKLEEFEKTSEPVAPVEPK